MFTEIYLKIFSFCDDDTKCNFACCSKSLLNLFYSTISCNQKNVNKCIKNNQAFLLKEFIVRNINFNVIFTIEFIIEQDNLFMLLILLENKTINNYEYYLEYSMNNNASKVFDYLINFVTNSHYDKYLKTSIKNFDIFKSLVDKICEKNDLTTITNYIISTHINKDHISELIICYLEKMDFKKKPLLIWVNYIIKNFISRDDNRIIKIIKQQDLNVCMISLFKKCCKYDSNKCLDLLLQEDRVRKYITRKYN